MGLSTLIQIPCHHVLANDIALNFKYHICLKQFFNINFGIGIIKKTFFCLYFQEISLCFYSNFDREISLDVGLNSTSNKYPCYILLMDPATPKTRMSGISCFWGSRVHQKYALSVLVGCRIKFCIQRVPTRHTFYRPRYPKTRNT